MWPEPKPKFKPAVWRFAQAKQALDAVSQHGAGRPDRAPQPHHGQSDRGQHLRHDPASRCRLSVRHGRRHARARIAIRPPRCGSCSKASPASTPSSTARAIDMMPGDVLLTPAWCWHGHVNETDETGYWIDFLDIPFIQLSEAMFFEPYPSGGIEPVTSRGPTPMRIPSGEALGPGRDAKTVEIAKDVMPTIALHLIRQPKGGRHRDAEEHDQQHLCRGRAARRASRAEGFRRNARGRRRGRDAVLARARDRGGGGRGGVPRLRRAAADQARAVADGGLTSLQGRAATLLSSPAKAGDPVFSKLAIDPSAEDTGCPLARA